MQQRLLWLVFLTVCKLDDNQFHISLSLSLSLSCSDQIHDRLVDIRLTRGLVVPVFTSVISSIHSTPDNFDNASPRYRSRHHSFSSPSDSNHLTAAQLEATIIASNPTNSSNNDDPINFTSIETQNETKDATQITDSPKQLQLNNIVPQLDPGLHLDAISNPDSNMYDFSRLFVITVDGYIGLTALEKDPQYELIGRC